MEGIALARRTRRTTKRADAGNDVPFEQAFSTLAHTYIADKAPKLIDYEVGFQLIDRDDEDTKAVGIVAFKVGSQWMYAPVFFVDGDLKGHELLYLRNQDTFVPLQENWINYLLNKKPRMLGEGVNQNDIRRQVMPPSLSNMTMSPTTKMAMEAMPTWAQDAAICLAKKAASNPCDGELLLPEILREGGRAMLVKLASMAHACPDFETVLGDCYEMKNVRQVMESVLKTAMEEAGQPKPKVYSTQVKEGPPSALHDLDDYQPDPIKAGRLRVHMFHSFDEPSLFLDIEQREKLAKDGVLIEDHREDGEVSSVFDSTHGRDEFFNPGETGVYDIIVKPGNVEKCLVAIGPHGPDGTREFATVVRLDGEKNWLNIHPSYIWATKRHEWDKSFKDLPDAEITDGERSVFMIIGPTRHSTLPFRVETDYGDGKYGHSYEVRFEDYARKDKPTIAGAQRSPSGDIDSYCSWSDGQRLHLTDRAGSMLRSSHGDVFIPPDCKVIKVKDVPKEDHDSCMPTPVGSSDPSAIVPGSAVDIQNLLFKNSAALNIWTDGTEVTINGERLTSKKACLSLVTRYGLREPLARELLKEAEKKHVRSGNGLGLRIKRADSPFLDNPPSSPGFPEPSAQYGNFMNPNVTSYGPESYLQEVEGMSDPGAGAAAQDINGPDPQTMQFVQQAAQTGQKEVFDTSLIATMLKATQDDKLIDRHVPALMRGMDRVGRILLVFRWSPEKFEERYGEQEMPELEDSLSTTFEKLGELILFLKQKAIGGVGDQGVDLALSTT